MNFMIFVYSHTHLVDGGFNPIRSGWNPRVVNTGAWQRVVAPETIKEWKLAPGEALRRTVDALPACYSLVWVAPYATTPVGEIKSWRQKPDSSWDFGPMCSG